MPNSSSPPTTPTTPVTPYSKRILSRQLVKKHPHRERFFDSTLAVLLGIAVFVLVIGAGISAPWANGLFSILVSSLFSGALGASTFAALEAPVAIAKEMLTRQDLKKERAFFSRAPSPLLITVVDSPSCPKTENEPLLPDPVDEERALCPRLGKSLALIVAGGSVVFAGTSFTDGIIQYFLNQFGSLLSTLVAAPSAVLINSALAIALKRVAVKLGVNISDQLIITNFMATLTGQFSRALPLIMSDPSLYSVAAVTAGLTLLGGLGGVALSRTNLGARINSSISGLKIEEIGDAGSSAADNFPKRLGYYNR